MWAKHHHVLSLGALRHCTVSTVSSAARLHGPFHRRGEGGGLPEVSHLIKSRGGVWTPVCIISLPVIYHQTGTQVLKTVRR